MNKFRNALMVALCALTAGAGIGVSSVQAQVYDDRCNSCYRIFLSCIAQCDQEGGEAGCYRACSRQRTLCEGLYCN